jgi:hypothetical protein
MSTRARERAVETSTDKSEGLRALHEWDASSGGYGSSDSKGSRQDGGSTQDSAQEPLRASGIDKRLHNIEKRVSALAKRLPTAPKPTYAAVAAASTTMSFGALEKATRSRSALMRKREASIPSEEPSQQQSSFNHYEVVTADDIRITMASTQQKEATLNNRDHIGLILGTKVLGHMTTRSKIPLLEMQ